MDEANDGYPGSVNLPPEVRNRVLTTYEQLEELARQGMTADVKAGCELLLKMDPLFEPAKRLLASSRGGVPGGRPGATPEDAAAKLAEARRAVESRDFHTAIELTNEVLRVDLTNEEAQRVGNEAQEKLEAGPFVEQFVTKARSFAEKGNMTASNAELTKAKALDAHHPAIGKFEQWRKAAIAAPLNAPTEPRGRSKVDAPAFDFGGSASPFDFSFGGTPQASTPSSSFVVDPPGGVDRTSAASDFGFSFEEDKQVPPTPAVEPTSDFSFGESPQSTPISTGSASSGQAAPPPLIGEAQTFDFTTASVETTAEDQKKIEELLSQGDEAFAAGDYQRATDIWSRVFLIDVTNHGASERIEKARARQDELDSRVDSLMSTASTAAAKGDAPRARGLYEEVLRIDAMNQVAADALRELASAPGARDEPSSATIPPPSTPGDLADIYAGGTLAEYDEFSTTPESRLDGTGASFPERAAKPVQVALAPRRTNRNAVIAIIAVAALAAGSYFAWSWWSSRDSAGQPSAQTQLTIMRAQALAKQGKVADAVALLSSVPANDPDHEKVLDLLADLKGRKSAGPDLIDGRAPAEVFAELVNSGRNAFETHDYIGARDALQKASTILPLPADAKSDLDNSVQQVAKLDSALVLFKEGNYATAIQNLEALQQQDPENQNVKQLIENAHYNLGASALRTDQLDEAITEFDAVLKSNPDDIMAKRSRDIAERYTGQPKDLLYRIYVKYLPLR
ncbi:MAG: tetratricopeptide repeat protein [Acidobacteriota bacterium]